jgi:hypothetical protein
MNRSLTLFTIIIFIFSFACSGNSDTNEWNNSNNINNINNVNNSNNANNINNATDTDGDGVPDTDDKCPGYNDNIDGDGDGKPDFCDPCPYDSPDDTDGDGVCNAIDKCEGGDDSLDDDNDGVPDHCDVCSGDDLSDIDNDGVLDCLDPCPLDNPDDSDGDSVCDTTDICNGGDDKTDSDGDSVPDFCDLCPGSDDSIDSDGDSIPDDCDLCPASDDTIDTDNDGIPDGCDNCEGGDDSLDDDNDGVCDAEDLCDGFDDTADADGDGIPDGCDSVDPGVYTYTRIPLGGMLKGISVAMSPDNSYFVVLEYLNRIHIYDMDSEIFSTIDLTPGSSQFIYFREIEFDPTGQYAIITGQYLNTSTSEKRGVVFKFDHSAWQLNKPATTDVVTEYDSLNTSMVLDYTAVEFDIFGEVMLLGHNANSSNRIAYLFALDPDAGTTSMLYAMNTGADAVDMAKVKNVYGDPGLFIVGGPSGEFTAYYTEVTGTSEWTDGPGNGNIGNCNHTASHPSGDYALAINSSDAIYKFEGELLNQYSDAPRFATRRLWNIIFQPNGLRAIILGEYQDLSNNIFANVFEYRHGYYDCNTPLSDCEIKEVSISNFGAPPWSSNSGTYLTDAAWRTDCDGGIITGGDSSYTPYAFIATFQILNGIDCNW